MWHNQTIEDTYKKLRTGPGGLGVPEALGRLREYGSNELTKEERPGPWAMFFGQFKDILIIILLVATILSLAIGETVDAAIIAVIVIFSAVLGFIQEYRAERAIESLRDMLRPTANVIRDGTESVIETRDIVPGDLIVLEAGDKVPADARIVEIASLTCDEAPLTGESLPIEKSIEPIPGDVPVGDRRNMVLTGSIVTYGRARAIVTETGMNTEFGKIAREVGAVKAEETPLEKRTAEIGKWLGLGALGICSVVIGISLIREFQDGSISIQAALAMVMFGISLAVAAVPEALAAIVTGALAIGMREMAKQNALIRKMPAVETLGCTTVICTDKTGTLTRAEMTVRKLYAGGGYVEVSGAGYEPKGALTPQDGNQALDGLLEAGVLCNDADLMEREGRWLIKGDSTEAALIVLARKAGLDPRELKRANPRVSEVPFSSERKMMSVTLEGGSSYAKGAPEVILERCTTLMDADGKLRPVGEQDRADILKANEEMASMALRVLGIAMCSKSDECADPEAELVFLGLAGIMDPPRAEALEAVRTCRAVHMKPVMITGDHKLTAMAIAREMGIFIEGDMVLTGQELEAMEDEEFELIVDRVSVYARVSPMDKLKIVRAWKKRGEVVAMTGDGVNDAPALKHADIGIAMGIAGTEVAREAADMVLGDDNFATIVKAVERGRWIYDNIKKYLTYLLRCNITEVIVIGGVVLVMGPAYLPMLPAAILYINLATDGLPALALGVAPADPDIMKRPPRQPSESVFSADIKVFIAFAVLIEAPVFLWTFFHTLPDIELARTRLFFLFMIVELVIALNFRSMRYGLFKAPPHKWLVLAVLWEVALIAVLIQIPAVRESFGIAMPRWEDLGAIMGFSAVVFAGMEIVKAYLRRSEGNA